MSNYKSVWANSALRPSLFGVVDSFAVLPIMLLFFDLSNPKLYLLAIVTVVGLSVLRYVGFTPQGVYLSLRRIVGRFLMSGIRRERFPFRSTIRKLLP